MATDLCTLRKPFEIPINQLSKLPCKFNTGSLISVILSGESSKKLLHFIDRFLVLYAHLRLFLVEHATQFVSFRARLSRQNLASLNFGLEIVDTLCALVPFGPSLGQFCRVLLFGFVDHVDVLLVCQFRCEIVSW